jgi:hypothetical protein
MDQSPSNAQVLATRVFHPNGSVTATRVFDLKNRAILQSLVARVFPLNRHTTEQVHAPRVRSLSSHNLVPSVFHRVTIS